MFNWERKTQINPYTKFIKKYIFLNVFDWEFFLFQLILYKI